MSYEAITGVVYFTIGGAIAGGAIASHFGGHWLYTFAGIVAGTFVGAAVGIGVGVLLELTNDGTDW